MLEKKKLKKIIVDNNIVSIINLAAQQKYSDGEIADYRFSMTMVWLSNLAAQLPDNGEQIDLDVVDSVLNDDDFILLVQMAQSIDIDVAEIARLLLPLLEQFQEFMFSRYSIIFIKSYSSIGWHLNR